MLSKYCMFPDFRAEFKKRREGVGVDIILLIVVKKEGRFKNSNQFMCTALCIPFCIKFIQYVFIFRQEGGGAGLKLL